MKISFFDSHGRNVPGNDGTSDTIWEMANTIFQLGLNPTILGFYQNNNYPFKGINVIPISVPDLYFRNIITSMIGGFFIYFNIILRRDLGIIHLRDYLYSGIFSFLKPQNKIVLTTPGNVIERLERNIPYADPLTNWVYVWAAKSSARNCDSVITQSYEQRDWWLYSGTSPLKINTIPLGVNIDLFHPIQNSREKLGFSSDEKIVLFVGRLVINIKGLDLLIKAFSSASNQAHNMRLVIVGDGPDKTGLEKLISQYQINDKVLLAGPIDRENLIDYYNAADVCVLPSRTEPYGRILGESMACGTPFIGSKHGGSRDIIINHKNGFIIDPEDQENFSSLLVEICTDPILNQEISLNGLDTVKRKLEWKVVMSQVINDVYTKFS